ncbi:golgin subfamily A member 6-like protein 4 [Mauremys mutica]|uniref:golgin subfamily A member 6-like protein 4 n=1 Tax=Mauremys mutica TaxID=74926 RepID=UPI001D1645B4|nr:golgin subfamily A member 6-like protein 4 [Mauremys mutica]
MPSSSAQGTMQSQTPKGDPAWTEREVLDLISIWGELRDHDPGKGTSAANVSMLPRSFPSQRLARIRRRNKRTCDEMFSELLQAARAQQNAWRQTVAEFRKADNERQERRREREERWREREERWREQEERWREQEERWRQRDGRTRDAMLRLIQEQTDLLRRLVELQERQQEHRAPLQSLYNRLPSSPSSTSSSP